MLPRTRHFALADEKATQQQVAERAEAAKDEKLPLWEADWNDEDVGEDFVAKLKREQ